MQVKFEGANDLQRKLKRLSDPKVAKRIARKAARQAMNIVRDAARQNAKNLDDHETSEMIHKNIMVSGGKTRNQNEIRMRVGIRGGAAMNKNSDHTVLDGLSGGNTTYWRFLEFGTSTSISFPFMRPALANNLEAVTSKFTQVFSAELDAELMKK